MLKKILLRFLGIKEPYKILLYEEMLYPWYEKDFQKKIDKATALWLQKEALRLLHTDRDVPPDVKRHWKALGDGTLPFGYEIEP